MSGEFPKKGDKTKDQQDQQRKNKQIQDTMKAKQAADQSPAHQQSGQQDKHGPMDRGEMSKVKQELKQTLDAKNASKKRVQDKTKREGRHKEERLDPAYPFHNLSKSDKATARKAQDKYNEVRSFDKTYKQINEAASNSSLYMDKQSGELKLNITERSIPDLLRKVVKDQLKGKVESKSIEIVIGKRFGAYFGMAKDLADISRRFRDEKLLSNTSRAGRDARFKEKVKLVAGMMAGEQKRALQNKYPSAKERNQEAIKLDLTNLYWKFDKAINDYSKYVTKDKLIGLKRHAPHDYERLRRSDYPKWEQG